MRARQIVVGAGVLVLAGCGNGAENEHAPSTESVTASQTPTVSVSATTDLVDGQALTITGSDFRPGSFGYFSQLCRDFFACAPYYGFSPLRAENTFQADASGSFQATLPVQSMLYTLADGLPHSCAEPGACVISVSNGSGTESRIPLSFRAAPPPAPAQKGTASIASVTPLTSGVLLRLQGAGWVPSRMLSMRRCTGAGFTECGSSAALYADASGAFDITSTQGSTFFINDPSGATTEIECAAAPGLCALQIADPFDFTGTAVVLPLTFPPPGTPTPLSATLVPNAALRDGDVISVQVSGFPAGWFVSYCQRGSDQQDCAGHVPRGGYTDQNGVFQGPLLVRRAWGNPGSQWSTCVPYDTDSPFGPCQFYGGEAYSCDTPGACEVVVTAYLGGGSQTFELPLNFIPEAPTAGTIALASSTVSAGSPIQVTGSGWGTVGSVRVSLCRKNSTSAETCRDPKVVPVSQSGTFSASLTAASFVKFNEIPFGQNPPAHIWHDCTVPGNCVVHVQGSTNSEIATELPVTVTASNAGGSVSLDLRSALIPWLTVRTHGSGWPAQRSLRVMTCGAQVCTEMATVTTNASGAFRDYISLGTPFDQSTDCNQPGACSLSVLDLSGIPTTVGPHVPLTFAQGDSFDVTSHYEAKWQDLLASGVSVSGLPGGELQRTGAAVTVWLFAVSGTTTGPRLPVTGDTSYTTSYTANEYRQWSQVAAGHDYTLDELQKVGALFWAWLLSGRPPLPN
ncbi:MAG TPA: hypothetical protein VK524_30625 [Polyangiaceae bacterium]|nr:hypothetical protein [Polyangiaceae bacterium]